MKRSWPRRTRTADGREVVDHGMLAEIKKPVRIQKASDAEIRKRRRASEPEIRAALAGLVGEVTAGPRDPVAAVRAEADRLLDALRAARERWADRPELLEDAARIEAEIGELVALAESGCWAEAVGAAFALGQRWGVLACRANLEPFVQGARNSREAAQGPRKRQTVYAFLEDRLGPDYLKKAGLTLWNYAQKHLPERSVLPTLETFEREIRRRRQKLKGAQVSGG